MTGHAYGCRSPPGRSMARIVAVPKAQSVSALSLFENTSTVTTPIEPDTFMVLARAIRSVPSAGLRKNRAD